MSATHGRNAVAVQDVGRADCIVTAEGHEHDPALAGAIAELRSEAAVVQVFGSFPLAS